MNRFLQVLNLLGILALAGLCVVQWRTNSRLASDVLNLELTRRRLTAHVAEQDRRIADDTADLDDFRRRVALAESELKDLQRKLTTVTDQRDQLAIQCKQLLAQRDQLKSAIDAYAAAVTARDKVIAHEADELKKLAADRDQVVKQFNDLADKYNAVVKQLNDERSRQQ